MGHQTECGELGVWGMEGMGSESEKESGAESIYTLLLLLFYFANHEKER